MSSIVGRRSSRSRACFSAFGRAACIGTTGSETRLVSRPSLRAPPDLAADTSARGLSFMNGHGWTITLTRAKLHIGAALSESLGARSRAVRSASVFSPASTSRKCSTGIDVDALSPALQPFPELGSGTADHAVTGEVWLTGGRIDAPDDRTTIADVAGTATRGAESMRFEGTVTIGRNRVTCEHRPRASRREAALRRADRHADPDVDHAEQRRRARRPRRSARLVRNVELGELEPGYRRRRSAAHSRRARRAQPCATNLLSRPSCKRVSPAHRTASSGCRDLSQSSKDASASRQL